MEIKFIQHRRIFYIISIILVVASITSISVFGLRLGIDFTGGSLLELTYESSAPSLERVNQSLEELDLGDVVIQHSGEKGLFLKTKALDEETHQQVLEKLSLLGEIQEGSEGFQTIGPAIGRELKEKTKIVIILSLLAILFYIAFSFRKISRPIKSWIFGFTSLIALFHDVLIPLGVFIWLGHFLGVELSIPIVAAFLTVFGYSINDSVVVFDRVRENLIKRQDLEFDEIVNKSLNQTLKRSFNTSITTLLVLLSIFFFGGETLKYFSLVLILGIALGTYSSIFLATPLLVSYLKLKSPEV